MKNKNLFKKIVFIAFIAAVLLSLVAPAVFSQTAPKQEKLLNGLKLLMWNDAKADNVSIKVRINAGSAFDPQGKEGVMQMLADNIFPNTASREFFAEDLGGGLEIVTTYDYIQINATSKPESFLTMIETLSAAVANPTIDKDTTRQIRVALLDKLKAMESDPDYVADQAVTKRLFGTFPYGRPQMGTTESVQKIEFPDLIDAKQRFLTADNATVTISGNFDKALGFKAARRYFGGWLKSDRRVPSTFRQPDAPAPGTLFVPSPKPEALVVRFAIRGTSRSDHDFAASQIFTKIIETRLKARAPVAHEDQIFVRNLARTLPGVIMIGFAGGRTDVGMANGKVNATDIVAKAMNDPVTDAEFQNARSAANAEWNKRDMEQSWLDADTYKLVSADADKTIFDKVTLVDVQGYASRLLKSPIASVLLTTPAK